MDSVTPGHSHDGPENQVRKLEPMSHGRTDLRKRKPRTVAVINDYCTGCAGAPVCIVYCPVDMCMFWVPDDTHPPFGKVQVDKSTCIGCAKCATKGPDGIFLDGCPWDAIEMVATGEWEAKRGVALREIPDPSDNGSEFVPEIYV
jgi:ferredoxin